MSDSDAFLKSIRDDAWQAVAAADKIIADQRKDIENAHKHEANRAQTNGRKDENNIKREYKKGSQS